MFVNHFKFKMRKWRNYCTPVPQNNFLRQFLFQEQQTPLHIASRLGNVDIVMLLLQHGAAVDSTTKDMYTALHIAGKEGQEEVKYLVGRRIMDHIDTVYLMERFYHKRQETFIWCAANQ